MSMQGGGVYTYYFTPSSEVHYINIEFSIPPDNNDKKALLLNKYKNNLLKEK